MPRLLRTVGTRMVLDQVNDMLVGTFRQQHVFRNVIRFLANDLRIPLVCVGMDQARCRMRRKRRRPMSFAPTIPGRPESLRTPSDALPSTPPHQPVMSVWVPSGTANNERVCEPYSLGSKSRHHLNGPVTHHFYAGRQSP